MIEQVMLLVCLLLTLISTGMLIIYFIIRRDARTYAFKLVFPIFLFDFIWSFNTFVPIVYYFANPDEQISIGACKFQGIVKLFTTNGSFFSALAISWTLFTFLIRNKPIQTKNPITYYSRYTFILPLIISFIPLICDRYGYIQPIEQAMCFLVLKGQDDQPDYKGIMLRSFLFYLPFILVLLLDFYFVIKIYIAFRKKKEDNFPREVRSLMLYPTILMVSWVWLMVERITEALNGGHPIKWLNDFDLHGATLNGFFNAIVYGYISINPFNMCYQNQENDYEASKDSLVNLSTINRTANNLDSNNNMSNIDNKSQNLSNDSNSIHIKLNEDYLMNGYTNSDSYKLIQYNQDEEEYKTNNYKD